MRLGFEAKRLFCNYTGLGNYARTLVSDLVAQFPEHAYLLFSPRLVRNARTENYFQNPHIEMHSHNGLWGSLWRAWGMGRTAARENVDVFHGLSNELPEDIGRVPSVVTIHDLIFRRVPHHFGRMNAAIYDWKFRSACRRADLVVAISEATRSDIERCYGIPRDRIRVVYQSCDAAFAVKVSADEIRRVREKHGLPSEYLITVGSIIERKNLLGVIKALQLMPHAVPLLVVGDGGAYKEQVMRFCQEQGLAHRVLFRHPVPFADLPALYQGAACSIYVSHYEGFGIPVIESQFGGTPVVTSNCSSLPEAGGPGSLQVPPDDSEAIAAAVTRFLDDSEFRSGMVAKGLEYVQRFRGERVASDMMAVYRELCRS